MSPRILICPDSFKGSLSATAATAAIARGIRQVLPTAQIQCLPLADGGEGTVEAFVTALEGERRQASVVGPLGQVVTAEYGILDAGRIAIIELAQASGLTLVPLSERDPTRTTTFGTGELILKACQSGAEEIWIGIGGSATHDGGAGIGMALGYGLWDHQGKPLPWGGQALLRLARINSDHRSPWLGRQRFRVFCDVANPLLGPEGAAVIYAAQKGANSAQIQLLERALAHFAQIVSRDLGVEMAELPGAGAAGGAGGGLVAFVGATLESGIEILMEHLQMENLMQTCDLIVTGEGRLDQQSLMGKVISGVLGRAAKAHKPVIILAGSIDPAIIPRLTASGIQAFEILSLTSDVTEAILKAESYLEQLARETIRSWR